MGKGKSPFRVQVPWYRWRWRLALVLPILLFGYLAVTSLIPNEKHPEPFYSRLLGALLFGIPALWCLHWTWKQRFPFKHEVRAGENPEEWEFVTNDMMTLREYPCGVCVREILKLRCDMDIKKHDGMLTGKKREAGELARVLFGNPEYPGDIWLRWKDGEVFTWDDKTIFDWFETTGEVLS